MKRWSQLIKFCILIGLLGTGCTKIEEPLEPELFTPESFLPMSPQNGAIFFFVSTISFDWSDVSGATKYQIQIDSNPDFPHPIIDQVLSTSSYTWNDMSGGTYYWQVRAGNGYVWSAWIDVQVIYNIPFEVGYYDTPGLANSVTVLDSYAYVADWDGLRVIDISTPSSPTEVGYCDTPVCAHGVAVSGSYAYVADGLSGLWVIDISTPSSPTEAGYYDTPYYAYDVAVSGSYAYMADCDGGFRVIDVSTPSSPTEMGYYYTPGYAWGVTVSGSYAYVADCDAGLRVIRIKP